MKIKLTTTLIFTVFLCFQLLAQPSNSEKEITTLVSEFLEKVDKKEMHDRFWAEDLIYTSSGGERFGKDKIMQGFKEEDGKESEAPSVKYTADDVQISVFGKTAALAFILVANTDGAISKYLNSGTLVKRKGEWVVVQWQATKAKE